MRRCFVTAWRVTPEPSVRLVIDDGPARHKRLTMPRRVSSPSAAKTGAPLCNNAWSARRDMAFDVLQLSGPAAVVHAERLGAARRGQLVETGFDDLEPRPAVGVGQAELDERRRLAGVVDLR